MGAEGFDVIGDTHGDANARSVAKGGFLTAYRWSGEAELRPENLLWEAA